MEVFQKELRSRRLWVEVLAEFIITALFISIVCGCSLSYDPPSSVMHMSISSGLGVATFAFTMWDVTCGLFNPALTIAYLIAGKKTFVQTVLYIIAQLLGSVCGAAMIYGVAPDKAIRQSNLAVNLRNPDVSVGQALGMEIWIGFILTLVVFSATDPGRTKLAGYGPPLSIGFSVFVNLNMSIPISGGGMNPARSFGPAVIMNSWKDHWIYWVGPIVGAVMAAFLYHYVFAQRTLAVIRTPEPPEEPDIGLHYVNDQNRESTTSKL